MPPAASLDGISGSMLHTCGVGLGALHYPIALKAATRLDGPMRCKGRRYWEIWKGSADPSRPPQSR
eukprot:7994427-Pyramimonas_sp.AAC.1